MISSIHGKLETLGNGWAIINVGGIGFQVFMPTSTLSTLGAMGKEVHLHTYLHVREDILALYGFASADELGLFQNLISVSGIGPKIAMSMLSAMNVDNLITAIATGSVDLLTVIPGIGKKTASRLIVELRDKIAAGRIAAPVEVTRENADVLAALTSLGYSAAEASRAITTLPPDENLSLEEKVKLTLQYFGGK